MSTAREFVLPELRAMEANDVPQVVEVEKACYEFPWSDGIFRDCLRVAYGCFVLAGEDHVVGYGIVSTGAGEAHILNLCIRPEWQGQGQGRRMLDHLLAMAQAAGSRRAYLEVRPSNIRALNLYEANGFRQLGVRRHYYRAAEGREDAVVLVRELG